MAIISESVWDDIKEYLQERIPSAYYTLWVEDLRTPELHDNKLNIFVTNSFEQDQLQNIIEKHIIMYFSTQENKTVEISYTISDAKPQTKNTITQILDKEPEPQSNTTTQTVHIEEKEQTLQNTVANILSSSHEGEEKKVLSRLEQKQKKANLNPRYTFDAFIPGENSLFSLNTAIAISKNPGKAHNPLLIHGGVGLGKTHIISSIGNYILEENVKNKINKPLEVIYVTTETFMNEFVNSIKDNNVSAFTNKYRKVDVLLIDDIQFLQNKESIQDQLFHTFNELYEKGKQMVFTADRPLSELKNITDRLKSRFQRGITVDITPPQYEIRLAILRRKMGNKETELSPEVLEFIAVHVETNVRDLEGAFETLTGYQTYMNEIVSIEKARELLKNYINANKDSDLDLVTVIRAVADAYGTTLANIKGKGKNQTAALPRHVAAYLCRELTNFTTNEIGDELGGRSHSTVINSWKKIDSEKAKDQDLNQKIEKIKRELKFSKS